MSPIPFDRVEQELISHYARRDFGAGLAVLDVAAPHLSPQWERVAYWRACLLARTGRAREAVDVLSQAVEAGALAAMAGRANPVYGH